MNEITMKMQADQLIRMALQEDITSEDVSTNAVMRSAVKGTVDLIAKEDGIIAGLDVYARVFQILDEKTEINFNFKDGDAVKKGDLLGTVSGDIRVLLSGERVALNYLQRMSGIATYTSQVAKLLEGSKVTLLDTRKTTPNCRVFEKYAVRVGGGCNHRYNLSDGVLLKDNHIGAAGSVAKAVAMAKEYAPFVRKIEVEVETMDQVKEAVEAGADLVVMHHPHVVQGMSVYDERTVLYSLGNFCFGGNRNVRAMESLVAVAELKFADDGTYLSQQITLYPAHISGTQPRSNYQPHLVTGKDAARVMRRVQADTRFALNPVDEATGAAVQETQRAN